MTTARQPAILVVDDVPANVRLLGEILRSQGYGVRGCHSGAEALAAAAEAPPDLILLDISMPVMDGYTVCQSLKADERLAAIPVIFISSLGETLDKVRAFAVGGVDYIAKPFEIEEVLARVAAHLRIGRLQKDVEEKNRELTDNYARLEELERLRDGLVHMIVHDLRNPLTAISTFLFLIQKNEGERLSDQGRGFAEQAVRSTDFLIDVIGGVLDVSKLESGQMRLRLEECDLAALCGEVVSRLGSLRGGRSLLIEASERPAVVRGDPQLLSRVLQNLAANALKFTSDSEGAVVLRVAPAPEEAFVRVTVRDNGPGIPPEDQGRVFDKFWQGEARRKGYVASSGLGLTFCKMIVEAHGGRIGIESRVGEGSTFWFDLPENGPGAQPPPGQGPPPA